ncbi:Far upstream element-binding protein 3 [Golovinomyces cichoracearum]|uniref:Far upstream element-binding protein 3 n=1 Tax=Golovinomyces cichoracearum TaxID=62708 RepID=A0A420HMK5_9PEZI|nr:Far upstream element-binding protein 3 [Golovinomyces cichoracearum]
MAEQPSISSILAALAAQRPNSIPPAQSQQPSYQQPQPPPNHYGQPGAYTLPQPTNSGSVDLSSIKPVNSGSVSIADAIAKAREIAAQKGVNYDRPATYAPQQDQRIASGRQYGSSRSRSRSPSARRDVFRDSLNPYRDERRSDRATAGRDYRERSFSPGPRGRVQSGGFSPSHNNSYAGRDRSPMRTVDDNSESLSIESNLVGLIIGRSGENLRRVEADSGCRVQFITGPEETGPFRQCKISGTRASRIKAKAEINRIIDDSGMAANARAAAERMKEAPPGRSFSHQPALRDGEDSMQIMVPDRTVGLIIGRGGETIRDLQERSGCHVNIVGEQKSVNGLRPVNLIGSREAAARAKDLIMEIVESDSKTSAGKDRVITQREAPRDAGMGGNNPSQNFLTGEKVSDSIFVPSEAVGMIIGKGGETIKDIQSTTTCKINVSPQSGPGEVEREIGLVGTRDSINAAKRAIEEKVETVALKNGGGRSRSAPQNDYGDRSYGQNLYPQNQNQPAPIQQIPLTGADDPYAAYGGYQNYVALWYQAIAQQQQTVQTPRESNKPPGTS